MNFERISIPSGLAGISVKFTRSNLPTLVLVHGFNDSKDSFVFLEEELGKHFRLVEFDFRGHGDSDWNEDGIYTPGEYLLDLHCTISSLTEDSIFLLGHSMGAGISARYAGMYPEKIRGLICLEGFSGLQPLDKESGRIRNWLDHLQKKAGKKDVNQKSMKREDAFSKLKLIYSHLDPEKLNTLLDGLIRETESGLFTWKNDPRLKTTVPIPFPPDLSRNLWKRIESPVLMIYGQKSHLTPTNLEEIKSHFRRLSFHEISGSSHNMHHDNPETVLSLIGDFMKTHFELMR
ncbi:MAG: alpha/beta hydrolase [Leptospiraceae bacterium]|nr:alpha/beta hydrolase [Leptospiraceae bacterium]MCP5511397.1 alpha/beta hydrolase [Leptospiraceae bacterium]